MSEQRKRGRRGLSESGRDGTDRQPSQPGMSPVLATRLPPDETDDLYLLAGLARCEMSEFLRRVLRQLLADRRTMIEAARKASGAQTPVDPPPPKPSRGGTWGR